MDNKELDENRLDKVVSIAKSVLGDVTGCPSIIGEIFGSLIPNQRLDRITKFIKELEKKLSALEVIVAAETEKQAEYLSLLENGMFYAYKASSNERLEYISSIVANGLTQEQIQISQYIYLLNLLSELNDEEIVWLRFYLCPNWFEDKDFKKKHESVLQKPRTYIGAPEINLDESAIKDSYRDHLERLGLIKVSIEIDKETNMPIYDVSTGKPKGPKQITRLGQMLLKEIGFSEAL